MRFRECSLGGDLAMPMNGNAVVKNGDSGIRYFRFLVGCELGRREPNVIGLPGQRRKGHVELGRRLSIERPSIGISDLD